MFVSIRFSYVYYCKHCLCACGLSGRSGKDGDPVDFYTLADVYCCLSNANMGPSSYSAAARRDGFAALNIPDRTKLIARLKQATAGTSGSHRGPLSEPGTVNCTPTVGC
jgi:hypothetical protein